MRGAVAAPLDADADIRWRNWQARGVEGDRRRAAIFGRMGDVLAAVLFIWLYLRLL